jgi:putative FmdB family regulatory protein
MPTYGYKCQNRECKFKFEAQQSIMADPILECPKCGQEIKRIFYANPFRFGDNRQLANQ